MSAAKIAHDNEVEVVLDAGHVRPKIDELLALSSWIIVPVSFVRDYFENLDLFVAARELLAKGDADTIKGVIITNGAGGCVAIKKDGEAQWHPSYPVKAVDTTGAGDIFHAGFIHGLLREWDLESCVRWAAASAALSITALGSRGNLPAKEDVVNLLRENGAVGDIKELDA
ncbi:putative sugar kinase YdjH [bacterium BMS3Bbin04]|nr:putative sugar kinase YdjH [bacterium BMS3Bbin04]